ncbi:hypothetical protein HW555_013582 [Spodoptera exigua]|uniref:Uncharacterized protein n=1 Tax=Spodoptera exigua TaxID=7107 RepID=A0A835KZN6_SPOEX|nr:hypothetical protein HW555_013582 [Spodoptera exigua]
MRIIHFGKLVEDKAEEFTLKNCSVVIDGHNFFHNKYEHSRIPFVFGGDLDRYAAHVRNTVMGMFTKANVKCYIVFKGGDTDINQKIEKFGRFAFDAMENQEFLQPILLRDVNQQIVDEMELKHTFCITESKNDCVALAMRLGCPVISRDIEFCFKAAPYIPETSLKFNSTTNTIDCCRYTLQNFLQKLNLTENKMATFGVLSDTTKFPELFFDKLLKSWDVPNKVKYVRHQQLILWLSKHGENDINLSITTYLKNEDDRKKFREVHTIILQSMQNTQGGYATEYMINSQLNIGVKDPDWFEKGVVCEHIPSMYVNLFKWQVIQGSWFDREDNNNNDSFLLSIDITKYAYNLLTNYKRSTLKLYHDSENYTEVDTLDPYVPRPSYECEESVFENGWKEIQNWNLFQHFLQHKGIRIELLSNLPEDCVLLIISLVYFGRRKTDVTKEIIAIIMSYVLLSGERLTDTDLLAEDLEQAKEAAYNYFKTNNDESREIYDGQAMKNFDEFQFCLQQMNNLNTLCGSPYRGSRYNGIYNGTFIYKFFRDLNRTTLSIDDFISDLLNNAPSVLTFVNRLIQSYQEIMNNE